MIFCVSLMGHNSTHFLFIWVCKLRCFLTEERRKEKGALLTEVLFVSDCPQKNQNKTSGNRKSSRPKKNRRSLRRQHPSLEKTRRLVRRSWDFKPAPDLHLDVWRFSPLIHLCVQAAVRLIWRPSVWLRPADSSYGRWAAGGLPCWRPSLPGGGGRRLRRADTDTCTDRRNSCFSLVGRNDFVQRVTETWTRFKQ